MYLVAVLIAASAAAADARAAQFRLQKILLAVNEEAAAPPAKADTVPETQDAKIDHTPLDKTPRGRSWIRSRP